MWAEMKSASRLDGFEIDEWWVGEGRGGGATAIFGILQVCVGSVHLCVFYIIPLLLAMLRCRICSTLTAMSDMFWAMA